MQFPDTWEEFEQWYGFEDKKEIYTNGSRLIQSFRVKQWLDHTAEPEQKKGEWKPDESGNVYWICSACGFASEAFGANILYHFCPNCGADMRI
jgi:rubrerythrin